MNLIHLMLGTHGQESKLDHVAEIGGAVGGAAFGAIAVGTLAGLVAHVLVPIPGPGTAIASVVGGTVAAAFGARVARKGKRAVAGKAISMGRKLVFPARKKPLDFAAAGVAGLPARTRDVKVKTKDGLELSAWYIPPALLSTNASLPVLMFMHGNGGTIDGYVRRSSRFAEQGYGVLMLEYRGYGGNPGQPSEQGLYADAAAGIAFLKDEGVAPNQIVLWGQSLGTGVAVQAAVACAEMNTPVGGVILEGPFTSVPDAAAAHYSWAPVHTLLKDKFDTKSRIASLHAPLLLMHGQKDAVIPFSQGQKLYELAASPKDGFFPQEAGHFDLMSKGGAERVTTFLSALPRAPAV